MGSVSWKGFTGSTGLFLACCGIATAVNILAGPYGYPDMFYITPYYPTTQPFFSTIAEQFGIMAGDLAYIAAIIMGLGVFGWEKGIAIALVFLGVYIVTKSKSKADFEKEGKEV